MKKQAISEFPRAGRLELLEYLVSAYKERHEDPDRPCFIGPKRCRSPKAHLAADLGITPQALSDLLAQRYYPSDELTEKMLVRFSKLFGYRRLLGFYQTILKGGTVVTNLHFLDSDGRLTIHTTPPYQESDYPELLAYIRSKILGKHIEFFEKIYLESENDLWGLAPLRKERSCRVEGRY